MKKRITLVLVLVMVLTLTACRGNDDSVVTENTCTTSDTTVCTTESTEATQVFVESTTGETTAEATLPETEMNATEPKGTSAAANTMSTPTPGHTHSYKATVISPTCTKEGYTTYKCACGDSYTANKVSNAHRFGPWEAIRYPSSLAPGLKERLCKKCGAKETEEIIKHMCSHIQTLTKEPTCIEEGVWTYTCSCGDTYTEVHPKVDHKYKETVVTANCLRDGYCEHTCSVCGDSFRTDEVRADPTAHTYSKVEKAATCTQAGYTKYTCSVCQASYTETAEALGHDFRAVACETNVVCDRCGCLGEFFTHNWFVHYPEVKPKECRWCHILWCDYYGHYWGADGHCWYRGCDAVKPE